MRTSFSGTAGGGIYGKAVGTALITITGAGDITAMSRDFILMWTRVGEGTTETATGTDARGTMNLFLTAGSGATGGAGRVVDIGKGKVIGASRTISPGPGNSGGT